MCVLNIVSDVLHPRVAFDARFDYFNGTSSHSTTHIAVCNAISSVMSSVMSSVTSSVMSSVTSSVTQCCGNHSMRVHSCAVISLDHC